MAANTNQNGPQGVSPAELERWLWTYAAGLMEPEEEAAMARYLANDPAAQERLDKMRQCFDTVAARSGGSLSEARARNTSWAFQLARLVSLARQRWFASREESSKELEAGLLAIAICRRGSLFALPQRSGVVCADVRGPDTLKLGESPSSVSAEEGSPRQLITGPDGSKITLTMAGEQKLDVMLELADKSTKGVAELRLLTTQGGQPARRRIAVAPIENGIARFQRSPAGLLEIVVPGAKPIVVGVATPPEAPSQA